MFPALGENNRIQDYAISKGRKLTTAPSSRPLAPNNCEPGLFITRTGTPIRSCIMRT